MNSGHRRLEQYSHQYRLNAFRYGNVNKNQKQRHLIAKPAGRLNILFVFPELPKFLNRSMWNMAWRT